MFKHTKVSISNELKPRPECCTPTCITCKERKILHKDSNTDKLSGSLTHDSNTDELTGSLTQRVQTQMNQVVV